MYFRTANQPENAPKCDLQSKSKSAEYIGFEIKITNQKRISNHDFKYFDLQSSPSLLESSQSCKTTDVGCNMPVHCSGPSFSLLLCCTTLLGNQLNNCNLSMVSLQSQPQDCNTTRRWQFGTVGSDVGQINEVTVCRARLVL